MSMSMNMRVLAVDPRHDIIFHAASKNKTGRPIFGALRE